VHRLRRSRRWRRLGWPGRALALALLALGLGACVPVDSYVSLGDSYTAGPLIPNQNQSPAGCLRSDNNYPHLVAPSLALPGFRDVSCSGADTGDMTSAQGVSPGPNPPQFNALDLATKLVTVGIGGNDIGFSEIVQNCSTFTDPFGQPCQDHYVVNGQDELSRRIAATAPLVAAVLQGIHSRSPQADVFVVGYPAILPDTGNGCWPTMPVAFADVPYLRAKVKELNAMLATQAAANGATYVDTYTPSIGHDACQLPTVRWIEPAAPASPAAPVHPNLQGMQGIAAVVLAAIQAG
jgi:lysophospholipase L1-like esterase